MKNCKELQKAAQNLKTTEKVAKKTAAERYGNLHQCYGTATTKS